MPAGGDVDAVDVVDAADVEDADALGVELGVEVDAGDAIEQHRRQARACCSATASV